MQQLLNLVDGRRIPAASGGWIDDIGPARGDLLCQIPDSGPADVDAAVAAARSALPSWRRTSVAERADLCDAVADRLEANLERLAELESADVGKPIALARTVDIPRAVANFRFFAGAVRHQSTGAHAMADAINYTQRHPVGVFGLITPWNLPLYLLSWKVAPALAMGNTVIAKPSELTPLTADFLAEILASLVPAGVFNLVQGRGVTAGQRLVEHPDVDGISFTGGTSTGRSVGRSASQSFKKLSLELGGKNPTIVFADADFDSAVQGAVRSGFANQGEICLCGSRVLVQREIFERFSHAFTERVASLRVGDPALAETQVGALISRAHRDKVLGYIALAREEGGEVLAGGTAPELAAPFDHGFFVSPTVIGGLSPDCRTATEEIFGPVVTLHPFEDEDEAIALANGVRFGLAASVWTTRLDRAHRVAHALDTGMVWVNTWLKRDLRVPFGGVKDSGVGREGGLHSLLFYSEEKNICIQL